MEEHRSPPGDGRSGTEARPTEAEAEAPDSMLALVPRRRLWPVFAVLALVLATAGFLVFRSLTATDPLRILVAIDLDGYWWEGSEPAARLADELSSQLASLGFDPVKGGDPKVMKLLESAKSPREAAKKLGAGFIIEAHLAPEVVEHPVKDGYFELRADAPVTLTFLDNGSTSEGRLRGYSGSTTKARALSLLADSMASQALDAVIAQLIEHPAVREITGGSDVKLLQRLNPAMSFAKDRTLQLDEAAGLYASRAREREADDQGRITFHSHAAAEDALIGVGEGGYFVKTADVVPFFSSKRRNLVRSEALETIEWRPLDGKALPTTDPAAPKPMWKGYHVYSYPSAPRGGDRAALVEDIFGWAKTITITTRAGTTKRVRVDPEHRFVDPRLSGDGRHVAVYDRPAPGAPADLMVLDTESGKEVFGFHTENQSLGGFFWLDDRRLGFVFVPQGASDPQLAVVDVGKQPLAMEQPFKARGGESILTPSASPDGKWIVYVQGGRERGLVVLDTGNWSRKDFVVEGSVAWPTFSPDAAHVVFESSAAGTVDVAALTLASGAVKALTQGRGDERLPQFSADGKRVLFEVRTLDPVFPRARRLSRIASVAFEP